MEETKKESGKIFLFILIVLAIITISGLLYYFLIKKDEVKEENKKETTKLVEKDTYASDESKWINIEEGNAKKAYIVTGTEATENQYSYFISTNEYNKENQNVLANYNCKVNDCKGYGGYSNYIVINDGFYFVYNYKTKKGFKLNLDSNKNYTNIMPATYENKIYGVVLSYSDNYEQKNDFYYLNDNAVTIDNLENVYYTNDYMYKIGLISSKNKLYNYKTKELIHEFELPEDELIYSTISSESKNNKTYYFINNDIEGYSKKIYNDKFENLFNNRVFSSYFINKDGNIYVMDNDGMHYSLYDNSGKRISTSKEYKKILMLYENYIAIIDKDNYLKLIDYNDSEVVSFTKWTDKMYFHYMLSGYYTGENKVYGIYLVVEDNSIEEGTKGRGKEYYYGTVNGETGVIPLEFIGGYAKPVLYLYPKKNNTKINVKFEHPNYLTTTYPKYNKEWNVIANKNGNLKINNKNYYALYWEENKSKKIDYKTGFYVEKKNAIKFLEEKLNILGLNERESNEFIMYWLPILEKNEKSLVYFETTEEREEFNKLDISPKPDSLLRIAIHVKKVDKKSSIKEQKLKTFKRTGFTAIEWGGVIDK